MMNESRLKVLSCWVAQYRLNLCGEYTDHNFLRFNTRGKQRVQQQIRQAMKLMHLKLRYLKLRYLKLRYLKLRYLKLRYLKLRYLKLR